MLFLDLLYIFSVFIYSILILIDIFIHKNKNKSCILITLIIFIMNLFSAFISKDISSVIIVAMSGFILCCFLKDNRKGKR